jgi:hypothetical protein
MRVRDQPARASPFHAYQAFALWSWYGIRQDGRLLWLIGEDLDRGEASEVSRSNSGLREDPSRGERQVGGHAEGFGDLLTESACVTVSAWQRVICPG